jgi:hypothetical protein
MFKTSSKITSGLAVMLATGALAGPASASMLDGTSPAPNADQIASMQSKGDQVKQSGLSVRNLPQGSGGFLAHRQAANNRVFVINTPDNRADRGIPAVRIEQAAKTVPASNSSDIDTTSAGLGLALLALLGGAVVIARRQTRGHLAS